MCVMTSQQCETTKQNKQQKSHIIKFTRSINLEPSRE